MTTQTNKLGDSSLMPVGKFKGKKMQDVPAPYLMACYEKRNEWNLRADIVEYIEDNMQVLKKEINAIQAKKGAQNG